MLAAFGRPGARVMTTRADNTGVRIYLADPCDAGWKLSKRLPSTLFSNVGTGGARTCSAGSCTGWRWFIVSSSSSALRYTGIAISARAGSAAAVISVGNLTVGGTGKTPVVEMLARALQAGGRRVAILSRGYKSVPRPLLLRLWDAVFKQKSVFAPRVVSDGNALLLDSRTAGDEPFMLANNLRGVVVLVDADRVTSGQYAIEHFGADTLLLDDGFQYVRMRHGIEVALIDSQAPFGNEFLLPRGTLREPPGNLRRATHIF